MSNLNPKQKEAVEYGDGPLLIAAGAGSGKTRTLTNRLVYLLEKGIKPENIIAITFTNKAAQEMRDRIFRDKGHYAYRQAGETRDKNLFIGTFHSLGARILKAEAKQLVRTANYTIFDDDDSLNLIKKITKEMNLNKEQYNPLMFQAVISKVKNQLADEPQGKIHNFVFNKYETALKENNAFDFDDLIQKVVVVFQNYPEILKKYQGQWQHILVDEFQDVNTSQYEMVTLLAKRSKSLSVVGDDFQAIYGFRMADYKIFLNFEKDWPNAKIVFLEQNYRSTSNIIQAANSVIRHNKQQKSKNLWTDNSAGELVAVIKNEDENEEAEWVVSKIKDLGSQEYPPILQSSNLNNIAILYRTNAQSRAVEQNLIAASIPYKIFGGIRFYDRKEIKNIVAVLRLASNSSDSVSVERLLKNLPKKVAHELIEDLPRLGKELNIIELINYFLNTTDYFEYLDKHEKNAEERIENINELIVFAGTFVKNSDANDTNNLATFLEQVSLAGGADNSKNRNSGQGSMINNQGFINLMSIHLAKGLEFKTVFVIGCNEGVLPHHRSYDERGGIEEERRLMYVAMTRAEKNLYLSFCHLPSRFLYEISPELIHFIQPNPSPHKNFMELDEDERYIEWE